MKIIFEPKDKDLVRRKLNDYGITTNQPKRIDSVLYNVEAAFLQQLDEEADYMINEFEADK
jgi:hypothetical protein